MLELDNVWMDIGAVAILKGVTLTVPVGQVVGLLGPNGAGKTSLLNTVSGIIPCREGRLTFLGRSLRRIMAAEVVRLGIGHVAQNRELFWDLTVRENLELGALGPGKQHGLAQRQDRVFTYFPILAERSRQLAGTLSGGEQQMLAIGRALMGSPRLLMLDEPSGGLAPRVVAGIGELILQLKRDGLTILLVEQNVPLASEVSDHVYVLVNGEIRAQGPVDAVRRWDLAALYLGGDLKGGQSPRSNRRANTADRP